MNKQNPSISEYWQSILETKGGAIAQEAKKALLNDSSLNDLREPMEFISKNWSDPLRPALMSLACEAVGGKSEDTKEAAVALNLINLGFYLFDDLIDKAKSRMFKPTFVGKYGENITIITGGLASAKAFTILNQHNFDQSKQLAITNEIWSLCANMAKAEAKNLQSRRTGYSSKDKIQKIETECTTNLATCLRIGAIIGNSSENEIAHLGEYGKYLGIIVDLRNDLRIATNLTLELGQKIATGALPYSLLWAKEHNDKTAKLLAEAAKKKQLSPEDTQAIVASVMETRVLRRIEAISNRLTKKALTELNELPQNPATQTLSSFVSAQPQLLEESLSCNVTRLSDTSEG